MRILISCFILCAFISCKTNIEFEGYIEYKITMTANNPSHVSHEDLVRDFGTTTTAYHKNGMFKDASNAQMMQIQLFLPTAEKFYSFGVEKGDTIDSYDIHGQKSEFKYEIKQSADTILGYPCDLLIAKNENVEKRYYFAPQLYINPKYYNDCTLWNKSELMEMMEAVTLRLIIENNILKLESEAQNVSIELLDDSIFALPSDGVITVKN